MVESVLMCFARYVPKGALLKVEHTTWNYTNVEMWGTRHKAPKVLKSKDKNDCTPKITEHELT